MRWRVRLFFGFAIAAMAAHGCWSDSAPSPDAGSEAGPVDSGSGLDSGSGVADSGSVVDSGMPTPCDASLPLSGDAGACTACKAKKCAADLAACAADCTCNRIELCLEVNGPDLPTATAACPDAISALLSGNHLQTVLTDCVACNCMAPCYPNNTGGGCTVSDAGGQ
jgi:hypothetical protein